jgi:hypothetical protein
VNHEFLFLFQFFDIKDLLKFCKKQKFKILPISFVKNCFGGKENKITELKWW